MDGHSFYRFSVTEPETGREVIVTRKHSDEDVGAYWHEVLSDFVDFLSAVYGYSMHDKIRIQEGPSTREGLQPFITFPKD